MAQAKCHRVLTVAKGIWGGVPNKGEGGVCLQEIGDDLGACLFQLVAAQPAKESQAKVL